MVASARFVNFIDQFFFAILILCELHIAYTFILHDSKHPDQETHLQMSNIKLDAYACVFVSMYRWSSLLNILYSNFQLLKGKQFMKQSVYEVYFATMSDATEDNVI